MNDKNQDTIDPEVAENLAMYLLQYLNAFDGPKEVNWIDKVLESRTYQDFTYALEQVVEQVDPDFGSFSVNDIVDQVVHYNREQFKLFMALVNFKHTYFQQ